MTNTRQTRTIPEMTELPRPIWSRSESWGAGGSITEWHQHTWGQFTYVSSGILKVETIKASYTSLPNYGIWIPNGVKHRVISDKTSEMRSLYVASDTITHSAWQRPLVCQMTPLLRELIIHFSNYPPHYSKESKQARVAQVIIDQFESLTTVEMALPYPTDKRLIQICHLLQDQPASRQSIDEWGKRVGLTGRSVSRLFMNQTGMTFQKWRQRARLLHALSLLLKSEPIAQVAYQCGYDSLSAFNQAFKHQFGCTASQLPLTLMQL